MRFLWKPRSWCAKYAIDLYRGSPAEEALAGQCDEDFDNLLAERACELYILPIAGIPMRNSEREVLLKKYGLSVEDVVKVNYDIYIDLVPLAN